MYVTSIGRGSLEPGAAIFLPKEGDMGTLQLFLRGRSMEKEGNGSRIFRRRTVHCKKKKSKPNLI